MANHTPSSKNWFEEGGRNYALYRPDYPPALAAYLASMAANRRLAVDVGCGSGQLAVQLADQFDTVVGLDPSLDQLTHAIRHERVRYARAPAERIPLAAGSASLIAAAQAAHWFDLPAFYREVRRIGSAESVLALVSYGVLRLDADLDDRFRRFYHDEVGPYWPPERKLVDAGYAALPFPFAERAAPPMCIRLAWTLDELLGYVATWSATRRAREAGREDVLHAFAGDLASAWGAPDARRTLEWPLNMRVGTL